MPAMRKDWKTDLALQERVQQYQRACAEYVKMWHVVGEGLSNSDESKLELEKMIEERKRLEQLVPGFF
jgi:ribosomal protein L18E